MAVNNKLQLTLTLIALAAALCLVFSPTHVDGTCNQCKNAHTCINETSFQICYNGVRNQTLNFTCPSDTPICTDYATICMVNSTSVVRGCGEVSQCNVCSSGSTYACTSLTTFARCSDGQLTTGRATCASSYVCSTSNAASDPLNVCVARCDVADGDICDRVEEVDDSTTTETPSNVTTTTTETPSNVTTTDVPSTTDNVTISTTEIITTTTTASSIITPTEFCADAAATGRYAIPNDTECTSYLYCFYKSNGWQAITYNCTASKPYFNANATVCGTTKPTSANCTI
ncbi:cell wall protein DAN4 [Drosophila willistoni]|uniref:cell wall protein DAN4 n=1 Tax=Drosophila willistoni TaxID=7260 RepID=UPI000C26D493|nr:cell wall protein DAN4 [Drosophila willistoni]